MDSFSRNNFSSIVHFLVPPTYCFTHRVVCPLVIYTRAACFPPFRNCPDSLAFPFIIRIDFGGIPEPIRSQYVRNRSCLATFLYAKGVGTSFLLSRYLVWFPPPPHQRRKNTSCFPLSVSFNNACTFSLLYDRENSHVCRPFPDLF